MSAPLDRWSRRRAAVQAEAEAEALAQQRAVVAERQAELAEKTDAEILVELDLPDPETLQPGDDFSGFMQAAVPERIRKLALRRLWRSNPVLANVDNLVDYGDDFTKEGALGKAVKTAYQVGKGILNKVEEIEAPEDVAEVVTEEPQALIEEIVEEEPEMVLTEETPVETQTEQHDEPDFAIKRRIRFQFAS
ncbi:DUF3306 domain-containing protein [Profundibacter sp.]|uniref:DUF3306 domain-containing protein n=1 Tax=Profundibacter sp. TaxID=3101071 RepID=UPI003D138F7D